MVQLGYLSKVEVQYNINRVGLIKLTAFLFNYNYFLHFFSFIITVLLAESMKLQLQSNFKIMRLHRKVFRFTEHT